MLGCPTKIKDIFRLLSNKGLRKLLVKVVITLRKLLENRPNLWSGPKLFTRKM